MAIQPLICWNDDRYANLLGGVFGARNVVTSSEQLAAIDFDKSDFAGIIVLAELRWDNRGFSQLYGIEIVKSLLRAKKKLQFPVLFVSFFPLRRILLDNVNKRLTNQLIGAVGHDFWHLPAAPETLLTRLEKIAPLNDLQFADVFNNLCNLKGLVGGRIHEIQGQFRTLQNEPEKLRQQAESIFEKTLTEIASLLKGLKGVDELVQNLRTEFRKIFSNTDVSAEELQKFLNLSSAELTGLIVEDGEPAKAFDNIERELEKQPWKILLLDDEQASLNALHSAFGRRGIEFFTAQTVAEAEEIIGADIFNEITVVVADYRLLESIDGVEKHQPRQGYDFLLWLTTQSHMTHLVALSGLSRKFLLESFQKYNTRVDVYSKQDLHSTHAVNLFADSMLDRGKDVYKTLCSRPVVGNWESLKPFYVAHRQAVDYWQREQEINNRASHFVRQYQSLLESRDETQLLNPKLEELDLLSTELKGKNPLEKKYSEIFRKKLVARRIALWIHLNLKYEREQIYAVLTGNISPDRIVSKILEGRKDAAFDLQEEIRIDAGKKLVARAKDLFYTHLCLSLPVISQTLLVEEKNWLETEIGSSESGFKHSVESEVAYFVQIGLEHFFAANPEMLRKIRVVNKDLFTETGKPNLIGKKDARQMIISIAEVSMTISEKKKFELFRLVLAKNICANIIGDPGLVNNFLELLESFNEPVN
ncbi:MAG: hypothetical protein WA584_09875 [Pyrinomonadaceae bacterium]